MPEITTTGGTSHAELDAWVKEVAAHTRPDKVVWIDGSDEEIERRAAPPVEPTAELPAVVPPTPAVPRL